MYQRIINLMQRQKHHGVAVAAAPTTVSLLTKSKGRSGAISSLSLSSSSSSVGGDSDQNNNNESASSTNNNVLLNNNNNNRKSTTHAVSKTCEGQLVARVIPKEYSDYDTTRKSPLAQVDSKGFISSLLSWKQKQKDMQAVQETDADEKYPQLQECISLSEDDEEAVVVLDLYLIRSAYIDQQLEKNNEASCQKQEGQSREQRIRALMNSLDVMRSSSSSHTRIKSRTSEVSKNNTIEPINLQSTLSTTTSSVSAINDNQHDNDEHEVLSNNIYHLLHMNRSSDELASRTLKRLELSTVRKFLSLLNNDEKKKVTVPEGPLLTTPERTTSEPQRPRPAGSRTG